MPTTTQLRFPSCNKTKVVADFSAGHVSSDGGVLLVRQADRYLGLTKLAAAAIPDTRDQSKVVHSVLELLRQRVYGLALGYEDLNDHDALRLDPAFQTAVGSLIPLASAPSLCRFEGRGNRQMAWDLSRALISAFFRSHPKAPEEIVLDFDPTEFEVHGNQVGRHFHAFYDSHCFLPLYVFCGDDLLVAYLRPASKDPAMHVGAVLRLLVAEIRKKWPKTHIIFRGDSGMCRHHILGWCERNGVGYVVGLAKNSRLEAFSEKTMKKAKKKFKKKGEKVRLFCQFQYKAGTWKKARRVIGRIEHSELGKNPRYVVTNLQDGKRRVYEDRYCARGDAENRIKEQKLGLFADRVSCHEWWSNQFRLLLSALAYTLINAIRAIGLRGTELKDVMADTIRLKLLKVGCLIERRVGRARYRFSTAFANASIFRLVAARLATS